MKLYFHPVSTASKPVFLFLNEAKIAFEPVVVDLMKGEHMGDAYKAVNPSGMVPAIDDEGFVLTECSAILKYLAEKHNSPAYPKDIQKRARINERMDWFNTQFYREYAYHMIYPQIFPHHGRGSDEATKATVEWGKEQLKRWTKVLNDDIIGKHKFVAGDEISIADYLGAGIVSVGDVTRVDLSKYPNIDRWMKTMRALPTWAKTMEATAGFAKMMEAKQFIGLDA
jgi:glutathione S-transferase